MKYIELEFEQFIHFSLLLFKSKSHSSNSLSLSLSLLILFSSFSSKSSNDSPVKENEVGITFGIIYLIGIFQIKDLMNALLELIKKLIVYYNIQEEKEKIRQNEISTNYCKKG